MAPTTSVSGDSGRAGSKPAKRSRVGDAAARSPRVSRGTSATQTSTARSTEGRSTRGRTGQPPADVDLTVSAAVRRDLASLAERTPDLAVGTLAATALALAREMDSESSATSKSMCANSLREVLDRLLELSPVDEEADHLDDLTARRTARLAGQSAASA